MTGGFGSSADAHGFWRWCFSNFSCTFRDELMFARLIPSHTRYHGIFVFTIVSLGINLYI